MSNFKHQASSLLARVEEKFESLRERRLPLDEADDIALAEEHALMRGDNLSTQERSKRAYELAEGAPVTVYKVRRPIHG